MVEGGGCGCGDGAECGVVVVSPILLLSFRYYYQVDADSENGRIEPNSTPSRPTRQTSRSATRYTGSGSMSGIGTRDRFLDIGMSSF